MPRLQPASRHQMTGGGPHLALSSSGSCAPLTNPQWPVDHLCTTTTTTTTEVIHQEAVHHLVKMTRPEDGRDGGIYSSDSAGQTPSLASIYQVSQSLGVVSSIYQGVESYKLAPRQF